MHHFSQGKENHRSTLATQSPDTRLTVDNMMSQRTEDVFHSSLLPLLLTINYGLIALFEEWPLLYFYCDDLDLPPQLINHNDL
jgi:hypothetical protein